MNKITLWICVNIDYWTAEMAIIASNVSLWKNNIDDIEKNNIEWDR